MSRKRNKDNDNRISRSADSSNKSLSDLRQELENQYTRQGNSKSNSRRISDKRPTRSLKEDRKSSRKKTKQAEKFLKKKPSRKIEIDTKKDMSRRSKKKRVSLLKTLVSLVTLIAIFATIYLIADKYYLNEARGSSYMKSYYDDDFDKGYEEYTSKLYYQKYIKNNESGLYEKIGYKDYAVRNLVDRNFEFYLVNQIMELFVERNISQEDLSLYIEVNNEKVLGIQENLPHSNISDDKIAYLLMIKDASLNGQIEINSSLSIVESDLQAGSNIYGPTSVGTSRPMETYLTNYVNRNDGVSKSVLDRHLSNLGISLNTYKQNLFSKEDVSAYSVRDMVLLMNEHNKEKSALYSYFNDRLEENQDLFLNAIYTNIPSQNKAIETESYMYDFGSVNSSVPFTYAIYSESLSKEDIRYIGDIINRSILDVNLAKNLYE